MTTIFDEMKNLEKTEEELRELRKRAEAEKRRCETIGCKLMASLSVSKRGKREKDLVNAENAIRQATLNLESLERRRREVADIERMGTLSGGVLTKWKKETGTRHMIEGHNKQIAAEREQNRVRKFGGVLTRKRR